MIISNEYDPVSPLIGAEETLKLMQRWTTSSAVLLTQKGGIGHGSLSSSNSCIQNHIKRYILKSKLPEEGSFCDAELKMFPKRLTDTPATYEEALTAFQNMIHSVLELSIHVADIVQ